MTLEDDRGKLEMARDEVNQKETTLSQRASSLDSREAELRRLGKALDVAREELDEARKACLGRERDMAVMEDRLREREAEATELEVRLVYSSNSSNNSYYSRVLTVTLIL